MGGTGESGTYRGITQGQSYPPGGSAGGGGGGSLTPVSPNLTLYPSGVGLTPCLTLQSSGAPSGLL